MKGTLILCASLFVATAAHADCYGSANLYNCQDESGNQYQVNKFGNMTQMQGSNPSTGTNWNQTTQSFGNSSYTNGFDSDGNAWSAQKFGNTTTYTDSNGSITTCSQIGDQIICN